jgi:hypothetical protein
MSAELRGRPSVKALEWNAQNVTSNRQPIFDATDRTDNRPAQHGEPSFEFLNRIAGNFWDHPRHVVQAWADNLAADADYRDLRARLQSRDDYQARSAFLELFCTST